MKYYYLKRHPGIFYYLQNSQRKYGFRLTYTYNHKQHEHSKRGLLTLSQALQDKRQAEKKIKMFTSSTGKTVAQWCHEYLEYSIKPLVRDNTHAYSKDRRKYSTYRNYSNWLRRYIIPKIGDVKLVQLTLPIYKKKCLRDISIGKHMLSLKTLRDINGCFKTVLNGAVENGEIKRNPLKGYSPKGGKDIPDKRQGLMNHVQQHTFDTKLAKANLRDQVMFITLENTGIRVGELLGLHWNDVDFKTGVIHVRHTRDFNGIRVPKTRHSLRTLPVNNKVLKTLKKYEIYCTKKYNVDSHTLILLSNRGKPISPNMVDIRLRHLLLKFGMPELVGKTTCHEFRHYFASKLIDNGVSISKVSKYLGHSNVQTTINLYVHTLPGKIGNLSKVFDKLNK